VHVGSVKLDVGTACVDDGSVCLDVVSVLADVEPLAAVVQASLDPVSPLRDAPGSFRRAVSPLRGVVGLRRGSVGPFSAAASVCLEGGGVLPDVVQAIRADGRLLGESMSTDLRLGREQRDDLTPSGRQLTRDAVRQ
jgi:hypothetical protein